MITPTTTSEDLGFLPEVLNCKEVADLLGIHVKTVRAYIVQGEMRAARLGKYYRIRKEWVVEFLDQQSRFH